MLRQFIAASLLMASPVFAGEVEIVDVTATPSGNTWRFDVTLRHADTGWDHYADGWEVLTPDGVSLGYRTLAHPHVNEQPFTRSLSGVEIPAELQSVRIRARDTDGWSPGVFIVDLNR